MNPPHTNPQGEEFYNDGSYKKYLIIGISIIAFMPFILTRNIWFKTLDFTETGPIGDTIGGITAPFIGILGAILVYISFNEQRKANRLQWSELENQRREYFNRSKFDLILNYINNSIYKENQEEYSESNSYILGSFLEQLSNENPKSHLRTGQKLGVSLNKTHWHILTMNLHLWDLIHINKELMDLNRNYKTMLTML